MVTVFRPPGVNVGVNNPGTEIYIKGNDTTDGSIRIRFEVDSLVHVSLRTAGVWSDTGVVSSDENMLVDENLNSMLDEELEPMVA